MKRILIAVLISLAAKTPTLSLCEAAESGPEAIRAKNEKRRATPRIINLTIRDEEGTYAEGAKISVILNNVKTRSSSGANLTIGSNGAAVIDVPPYHGVWDIYVNASDLDTKIGRNVYDIHLSQSDWIIYDFIKQNFGLTLPYVRKPIALKAKRERFLQRRVNDPKDTEPADPRLPNFAVMEVGYDAELLELMPPLGQGKHLDFTITVTSVFRGFESELHERRATVLWERRLFTLDEGKVEHGNWTHTVTYSFPNKGDGIILSPEFWPYCKLTVPHKAPEEGYRPELTLKEEARQVYIRTTFSNYREQLKNNGMFLRIRTQLDKDGNVVAANYAKIVSPQAAGNVFLIFYNPTINDRNLEYDLKTNLRWKELHPLSKEPPPWNSPYDVISN